MWVEGEERQGEEGEWQGLRYAGVGLGLRTARFPEALLTEKVEATTFYKRCWGCWSGELVRRSFVDISFRYTV